MRELQLREAKATLSAVMDDARDGQPTIITRHGRKEAVIIGFDEWQRLANIPSFARLLMSIPLQGDDELERDDHPLRSVEA